MISPDTTQEERKHYRKIAGIIFRLLLANSEQTQSYKPVKIILEEMEVISEVCPRELPGHLRDWIEMFRRNVALAGHNLRKVLRWGYANVSGTKAAYDEQHKGALAEALEGPFSPESVKQGGGGGGGGGGPTQTRKVEHQYPPAVPRELPNVSERKEPCSTCGNMHGG